MMYLEQVLDESSKGKGGRSFEFRSSYGFVSIELKTPGKVVKDQGWLWHCLMIPSNPVILKTF